MLDCAGKPLDLSVPQVMGVLNVTPDSFSDGGDYFPPDAAVEHALRLVEEQAMTLVRTAFSTSVPPLSILAASPPARVPLRYRLRKNCAGSYR